MALTLTTLRTAITAGQTNIPLTSGTGIKKGHFIRVDSEIMRVDDDSSANNPLVGRGQEGTNGVAHDILADAVYGPAVDFPVPIPDMPIQSYGADGAIAIPGNESLILIDKATAAALTIANPSLGQTGLRLTIMAETAQAHTVTAPAATGFNGGTSASDVATFGGAKGDNFIIQAVAGQWNVVVAKNVTLG